MRKNQARLDASQGASRSCWFPSQIAPPKTELRPSQIASCCRQMWRKNGIFKKSRLISFDDYARTRFGAVMRASVKAQRSECDCRALDKNRQNEIKLKFNDRNDNRRTTMNTIPGKTQYLIAAMLFAAAPACLAQSVLAEYNGTGATPFAYTTEAPGITAGTIGAAYPWYWAPQATGLQENAGATTTTAALAAPSVVGPGQYEAFTISSATPMSLSSLTFNAEYGNFSNPAGWDLSTSVDGFATYVTQSTTSSAFAPVTFDLSGAQFQGLTSITFEISGYDAAYGYETLNDISLNGPSAVPEPNTMALAGMGLMSMVGLKAWRRRS
ncbi:MAG: PEP-CTERM sorting domain-containing protein [Verrucomicrobiota bacterium]